MATGQYVKMGDAYFQQTDSGLSAVSDANTLAGLKSGSIASSQGNIGSGTTFAGTPASPTAIPATSNKPPQQPVAVAPPPTTPYTPPDLKTLEATTAAPYQAEEQQLKAQGDSFQQSIENILQKQTTEAARQAQLESQVGIPDINKNLVEIQNQIRSLNAEAFSATQYAEGRAAPMFAIQGEQERIQRLNSARQYGLAATAQALQGSLALAKDSVERALKAEFGGLESQLKYYSFLYDNNRDKLAQIDAKKAKALEMAIKERDAMIAEQKAQKSEIYQLAISAAQSNAPAALISQLLNSQSVDQALLIASQAGIFAPSAEGGFTLSEGQARYDAQGNLIASRAKTVDPTLAGLAVRAGISQVTGKPLTEGERLSQGFANRLQESDAIIDTLGSQFTGVSSYLGPVLPNALKSSERQQFEQAQRNFINAILRRESGAVISPEEFANARQQYFPQPGDTPEVLAQKDRNRQTVIASMFQTGGIIDFTKYSENQDPLGIL